MDISQREGKYPPPAGASPILGVEFSGTIAELGEGVTQWKANDEVLGLVPGVSFFAHDAFLGLFDLCVCECYVLVFFFREHMQNMSSWPRHTFGESQTIYHG